MSTQALTAPTADRPVRLLIVEDNPDDALLIERVLRRSGMPLRCTRVETAEEMSAALDPAVPGIALADLLPDLIIADYNLPRFSGPAALQLLHARALDIPFIMTSGAISEETAVESMRAGAQDYVTKQNLARLVPVVERELREAATRRSRRAAEIALEASQTRFHRLIEAMPIGLFIADSDGVVRYRNRAVQRLIGYPAAVPDDDTHAPLLRTILPDWDALQLAWQEAGSGGDPLETTCLTDDGQSLDVLVGIAQLNPESADSDSQTAAFLVDLTLQRKSAEILRRTEKLAVAGRFAASIAHEINNPLEAITNCLYLVSQTTLPDDARTYLDMAQKELNRVAQITVQTLRFYRRSTQAGETDLHDLLENVLSLLDSRLRRAGITVERDFGTTSTIVAHDGEIRQVFANLIGNAIDALHGGGRLILRTRQARDWRTGCPGIRVSIADTGTGMSDITKQRLFEPFYSTKGITGTGLGLWISREILEKHQGTLRVRSRAGIRNHDGDKPAASLQDCSAGTVFSLFLPALTQQPEPPTA